MVLSEIQSDFPQGSAENDVGDYNSILESPKISQPIKLYKRRFWVLGIFSFFSLFQVLQWNLWGPISDSVSKAYNGWGSTTVSMMSNWGPITFVVFFAPMVWLIDSKGLRMAILTSVSFVGLGAILKILPILIDSDKLFQVVCHLSAILNGITGPVILTAPPLIAATWFPPNERTTATAFGQMITALGSGASYLEPLFVRSPEEADRNEIRSDLARLLSIYAGIGVALFIAIFIYFPAKPKIPPSLTSCEQRLGVKGSIMILKKNVNFILMCLSYVMAISVIAVWITVLNYSLKRFGINQDEAMWIGFLSVVGCVVSGLMVSRVSDVLHGHLRVTIMVLLIIDLACFYWFFLLTLGTIAVTKWQVFVSVIAAFSFTMTTLPLFTEMAMENVYPCSELVVAGLLSLGNSIVGSIFLVLFLIPDIGYDWVTYVLLGSCLLALILMVFVKEEYKRTNIDSTNVPVQNDE